MSQKRVRLDSSSAASTSSSRQKGGGLISKRAKSSAAETNPRSPPESSDKSCTFLPGGCTITSTPAGILDAYKPFSSSFLDPVSSRRALPPLKSVVQGQRKLPFTARVVF